MVGPEREVHATGDWDVYWRGTHENAAHREGGPQEVVLAKFWESIFQRYLPEVDGKRVLDMACGNGAVTGFASQSVPGALSYCLDSSLSAVLELQKRYPRSMCVAADVLQAPFEPRSFDIVCSQFGIEYAGPGSLGEVSRLVAPRGVLAVVLHLRNGAIYRECEENLRVINAIADIDILPLAGDAFGAGFALNAGLGSAESFKAAERKFTPAVRNLEGILRNMGGGAADGLPQQIYRDISHMYRNMSAFDKNDVLGWLEGMEKELDAYAGRMSSMLSASLDNDDMRNMVELTVAQGLVVIEQKTLTMGSEGLGAAWALVCQRSA